jgi:hypothetical protein
MDNLEPKMKLPLIEFFGLFIIIIFIFIIIIVFNLLVYCTKYFFKFSQQNLNKLKEK